MKSLVSVPNFENSGRIFMVSFVVFYLLLLFSQKPVLATGNAAMPANQSSIFVIAYKRSEAKFKCVKRDTKSSSFKEGACDLDYTMWFFYDGSEVLSAYDGSRFATISDSRLRFTGSVSQDGYIKDIRLNSKSYSVYSSSYINWKVENSTGEPPVDFLHSLYRRIDKLSGSNDYVTAFEAQKLREISIVHEQLSAGHHLDEYPENQTVAVNTRGQFTENLQPLLSADLWLVKYMASVPPEAVAGSYGKTIEEVVTLVNSRRRNNTAVGNGQSDNTTRSEDQHANQAVFSELYNKAYLLSRFVRYVQMNAMRYYKKYYEKGKAISTMLEIVLESIPDPEKINTSSLIVDLNGKQKIDVRKLIVNDGSTVSNREVFSAIVVVSAFYDLKKDFGTWVDDTDFSIYVNYLKKSSNYYGMHVFDAVSLPVVPTVIDMPDDGFIPESTYRKYYDMVVDSQRREHLPAYYSLPVEFHRATVVVCLSFIDHFFRSDIVNEFIQTNFQNGPKIYDACSSVFDVFSTAYFYADGMGYHPDIYLALLVRAFYRIYDQERSSLGDKIVASQTGLNMVQLARTFFISYGNKQIAESKEQHLRSLVTIPHKSQFLALLNYWFTLDMFFGFAGMIKIF